MNLATWIRRLPLLSKRQAPVDRAGSEGEMALNRVVFCFVVGARMIS